jgi:hypothetical protein
VVHVRQVILRHLMEERRDLSDNGPYPLFRNRERETTSLSKTVVA